MKNFLPHRKNRARGFLSVELGLVLLVLGVLIVGAVLYLKSNLRSTSIGTNVGQVQFIAGTAKKNYGQANRYGGVTTAQAVQTHVVPDELRDGNAATATNSYGGQIAFAPANGSGTNDLLTWNWSNTPADECNDLVTGVSTVMRRITVEGTDVQPLDGQLDTAALAAECERNGAGGRVRIDFFIGRS
jgi:type II secretory pathway pseudopilin PulG